MRMTKQGTDANWQRLAFAVLARAVLDAQEKDPALTAPARRWLAAEGVAWAEWLELHPERMTGWLESLPALLWEQLTLPL